MNRFAASDEIDNPVEFLSLACLLCLPHDRMALLEFSMTPLGLGESVSSYVARCVKIVEQSGLDFELHAMGTIVEGEIDQLLDVLERCFAALATDCDRISCSAKFDYRRGASGRIQGKVDSVHRQLGRAVPPDLDE